jgi:hypothetical protein
MLGPAEGSSCMASRTSTQRRPAGFRSLWAGDASQPLPGMVVRDPWFATPARDASVEQ